MAGEQEIITKFKADTSELSEAITKEEGRIKALENNGVAIPIAVDDKKLNAQLGAAQQKFVVLDTVARKSGETGKKAGDNIASGAKVATAELSKEEKQARATAKAQNDLAKATDKTVEAGGKLNIFQRIGNAIRGTFTGIVKSVRDFTTGAKEGFKQGIQGAGGFKGVLSQIGTNIRGIGARIRSAFTGLFSGFGGGPGGGGPNGPIDKIRGGLDAAGVSTGRLGGLLRGLTTPFGLLVGASAGFLLNMTRLDSVKVILDGVKRGVTGVLDQLAAGKLSISGFFDAFARGQQVAKELDTINDRRQAGLLLSKQEEEAVDKLLVQAKNRTRDAGDRITLLREAQRITEEGSKREIDLAQQEANLQLRIFKQKILDQNNLTKDTQDQINAVEELTAAQLDNIRQFQAFSRLPGGGFTPIEIDDEAAQAAIDAVNKVRDARIAANAVIETAQNRIDQIADQAEERQEQRDKRESERTQKLAEDRAKLAEKKFEGEKVVREIEFQVQDEAFIAGLTGVDRKIAETAQKFDQRIAEIDEKFRDLRKTFGEGTPTPDTAAIQALNEQQAAINLLITQQQQDEEAKIRKDAADADVKDRKDALETIRDLTVTADQLELDALRAKYEAALEENRKFFSENGKLTEQGLKQQADLQASFAEQEAEFRKKDQQEQLEKQTELLTANIDALTIFATQSAQILGQAAADGQQTAEEATKQLVTLALDQIEKLIILNTVGTISATTLKGAQFGGPLGATVGLAGGIAITAIIAGFFQAAKAAVQGAYEGEERVGAGERPLWPGRDGYLRRVHKNEGIVDAETNMRYLPFINAMRSGDFEQYIEQSYVIPSINAYMSGDAGQRMASSVMLAKYYDKNIVDELRRSREVQGETNVLLKGMLKGKKSAGISKRYY